jgi:ribosomal protein S18 acetylase RimI-like enzyme
VSAIRAGTTEDAARAAQLHAVRIADGFLVRLGARFLTRLYGRVVRSNRAFLLVAADAGGLTGFISVASDTGAFYREFLLHDGVMAGIAGAPAIVRAPKQVWETFHYGTSTPDDLPRAEVLAIAVVARATGHGLGGALVAAGLEELRRRGVQSARVVTAVDNGPALAMYERAGFRRHHVTEVHAGVAQQVLVWR